MKTLVLICMFSFGFGPETKLLNSVLNHPKSEVIEKLGPPDQELDKDEKGNVIMVYKSVQMNAFGSYQNHFRYIYLDSNKVCYHWKTKDEPIPAQVEHINANVYHYY